MVPFYVYVFCFNLKGFSYIFSLYVIVLHFCHSASRISSFQSLNRVSVQSAVGNIHRQQKWPVKMVCAEVKRSDSVVTLASTVGTSGMQISCLRYYFHFVSKKKKERRRLLLLYLLQFLFLFSIHCLLACQIALMTFF